MKNPVRVLLIDHESLLGGAEISMVLLAKYMPAKDVKYMAAIAGPGEFAERLYQAGIQEIYFLPMDGWRWWETGWWNRLKILLSLPVQAWNIIQWVKLYKKIKPDIVHFNLTRLIEPVVAAKICGLKTLMHFREHIDNNMNFWGGNKALFYIMNLCGYGIANSLNTEESLKFYRHGVKIIYNGVETERLLNWSGNKLDFSSNNSKTKVAMLATLVPWKNHLTYFKLASIVCKSRKDILFIVAGKGGEEYTDYLKRQIKELHLEDNVVFTGFIEDYISLLWSIDILIHTSSKESFGKIYIEAMAAKKPVLALHGGAADELIQHGINGFLYNESQIETMAEQLIKLVDDNAYRQKLGINGQQYAVKKFSMKRHCEEISNLYRRLLP